MYLTTKALCSLIDHGVINTSYDYVNGASIDVTLGEELLVEHSQPLRKIVYLFEGDSPFLYKPGNSSSTHKNNGQKYYLAPGEFILCHTAETLKMPNDLVGEFRLRSTLARCGLEHSLAGLVAPGFSGQLTLELRNNCQYHTLVIVPGLRIGQITFARCEQPVALDNLYQGRYQGSKGVMGAKW